MKKNARNFDTHGDGDNVVVVDNAGRRRFMRVGAAFVLASSATATEEKNPEVAGNDSDAGAEADRVGCGRQDPPAISEYKPKRNSKTKTDDNS